VPTGSFAIAKLAPSSARPRYSSPRRGTLPAVALARSPGASGSPVHHPGDGGGRTRLRGAAPSKRSLAAGRSSVMTRRSWCGERGRRGRQRYPAGDGGPRDGRVRR
jgi:hypothetical protein